MKKKNLLFITILFSLILGGCKKYLDEKSDLRLMVPVTLGQLQSILDNYSTMNNSYCSAGEVSSDDYYLYVPDYEALEYDRDRRLYTWEGSNLFAPGSDGNDWSGTYRAIYSANSVLEKLDGIARTAANAPQWDDIKAQALLFRGSHLLDAAMIWANAYNPVTAAEDPGLPIPLTTDFNLPSQRLNLRQTYEQIVSDLRRGTALANPGPISIVRPGKGAGYGLLARTYLYMGDFTSARRYADSSLQINSRLINFNQLNATNEYPIAFTNVETVFSTRLSTAPQLLFNTPKVTAALLATYDGNDLRKTVFFVNNGDGTRSFKGYYTGDFSMAGGIATDEMYLIRAEASVRLNNVQAGIGDLNTLLNTRWRAGTYIPLTISQQQVGLEKVLLERRKELLMRGIRWADIKRLNVLGAGITLNRNFNGQSYALQPNDRRFALPIPEDVINLSGMTQNP